MEIKEIDGKKYVEYDEHKANRNYAIRQMIFLILIALTLGFLIAGIINIQNNSEQLKMPLQYNLERFGIDNCYCQATDGDYFTVYSLNKTFETPLK